MHPLPAIALLLADQGNTERAVELYALASRYPFVATMVYFFVVEVGLSSMPGRFKVVSTAIHLQVLAGLYKPKTTMFVSDPILTAWVSLAVVTVMTLVWLVLSVAWVQNAEYRTDQ